MPLDVHVTPALLVALEPAVIFTAPELEQVVMFVPATAVGAAVTVITTVEVAAAQGPAPSGSSVVKVNVTVPLVMLGV